MEAIEVELAAGARAFAFKNYAVASECFSKACESLNTHHPQNIQAVIDAHVSYGKALLRNAIAIGSVLGGPLPTEPDPPTLPGPGPSKDQPAVASTSNKAPPAEPTTGKAPQIHFSGDSSDDDDSGEEGEAEDDADQKADGAEEPVTVEEELDNAFQALEFARQSIVSLIDGAQESPDPSLDILALQKKLVDVYEVIAQVHQEDDQFELAVEAYKSILEIKKTWPDCAPGAIAESHLMIALALELVPDNGESLKQAVEHVEEAIGMMRKDLSGKMAKGGVASEAERAEGRSGESAVQEGAESTAGSGVAQEISEIESMIQELEAKREELKTVPEPGPMTEGDKALHAFLANMPLKHNPSSPQTPAVVNDIDKLVKKRTRPAVEDPAPAAAAGLPATAQGDLAQTPSKKQKI